jgi:flagellar protein FliS
MRSLANPYEKYRQQNVMVANPVELIIMLYDGCIKNMKLAKIAIGEENLQDTNTYLIKAQDIITELIMSLDFKYPIANELMNLYDFILRTLREINISKKADDLEPLMNMLNELKQSWGHVLKENKLVENLG